MRKAPCRCLAKFCAKLLVGCIVFCDSDSWRSSLQMVRLNSARSSQSKFQETIVPRVIRVSHVPPRHRQSAKHKAFHLAICKARSSLGGVSPPLNQAELRDGREGVARDAKCAVVKRSFRREAAQSKTSARAKRSGRKEPRVRRGISVREAADRRWRSRADETLTGAPNERRNAVRDPKTPSRPSPCVAPRARVVPEP